MTDLLNKHSFVELGARQRARALLDSGTFRELIDPFQRVMSPWLSRQGVVPQADDGVVIAKGSIAGLPVVIAAIEGNFQGGSLGEVGGAKIAGALELAAEDNRNGIETRAVLLLETGGVRLQEANLGLAAIADIHAAIVDLRQYQPVIGVVAGSVGCFGGMSIAAGLCSYLVVTREARLGLNGPQVIEQEAGLEEYDSRDRPFIWSLTGGEQRFNSGLADRYVADDVAQIQQTVTALLQQGVPAQQRSRRARALPGAFERAGRHPANRAGDGSRAVSGRALMRGLQWFNALSAGATAVESLPASLKVADGVLGGQPVRFIAVVTDPDNRFPRARNGEVGLLEGWGLAKAVDDAIARGDRRPIIAIVDVPSQAYGRREEALGIHQALAAAADSYARARLAGHPVIGLLVGKAMSGAFLAHGYQANRLIALRDPGVMVHAMGKASAARVTLRSVEELEALAASVPPMAYDIDSFASLGLLWETLSVSQIEQPTADDVARVGDCLLKAINDVDGRDLSGRLGASNRAASSHVRQLLREQW
ncbi:biotin-independent malonate decarboxylase subunit beta [Pseudomonas trivialis]|uniref:biotin-independent malonate decarboxylase subunit beta n=2 Tax=Pseudomonas trivialis TaxID=200450 RepID=UPI0030CE1B35